MKTGNQQPPSNQTLSPLVAPNVNLISNKTLVKSICSGICHRQSPMTARYINKSIISLEAFIRYAPKKHIASNRLRFSQLDTWVILNSAARLKDENFLLAELKDIADQYQEKLNSLSFVILADRRGRPAVAETTLTLFRKALTPGKTIHGKKKMHVEVFVPEAIWETFLIKALGWWVKSGTAPEHLIEMQLDLDLGL